MKLSDQIFHKPTLLTEAGFAALKKISADSLTVGGDVNDFYTPRPLMTLDDNLIAWIHITGVIGVGLCAADKKMGNTDADDVIREISEAQDKGARGIIVPVTSPGGTVTGTPELASALAWCDCPVFAHVRSQASSAGYWSIAASTQIWAEGSALVGSIGVLFDHTDTTGAMEQAGLVNDGVSNAEALYKVVGGNWTEDQREYFASICDRYAGMMKGFISTWRGGIVPDEAMRGQEFVALDAQVNGLVDQIGSLEECYAHLLNASMAPTTEQELDRFFESE